MSQDQTPEKVKLYSGGGGGTGPRGVRAVSGGGGAAQRRGNAVPATAAPALAAAAESRSSGISWLVVILFVLGCALGGGLFTAFVPF
jgi:hypothetical protein